MPAVTDTDTEAVPRSVGRVLDLLEIVLAERSCTLTTAAAASDLTPTTALPSLSPLTTVPVTCSLLEKPRRPGKFTCSALRV